MSFDASGRPVVVWSQGDSSTEVTEENFVDDSGDFQLLVQRIESMRGHREYFNRGD